MKVSIITVCFNSEKTIRDTIKSVLSQSYYDIEFIIIDGNSKDKTVEIINEYKDYVDFFITENDNGIYDAMNKGLSYSSGDIVCMLNSDDFYINKNVISNVISIFMRNPNTDMVLGNVDFVNAENLTKAVRVFSSFKFSPWKMFFGFMPAHPAAFIKKTSYIRVGYYSLEYKISADFDWFVRAFLVDKLTFVKINNVLVRMRIGGISTEGFSSYWLSSKEQVKALKSNGFYTNILFVLVRLPIKFLKKYFK